MSTALPQPILIAGPTASGKSALALQLARRCDGLIINADSMQVYRELRILTARPSPEDEAAAAHCLYGHVGAGESYSVARWLDDVALALDAARRLGQRPIIVGGTGLYFKALGEGLSPIPPVPAGIRDHWRAEARRLGPGELHRALEARDPETAARLAPGDLQRLTRALEVLDATGRSLADWQRVPGRPLLDVLAADRRLVLLPRHELRVRTDTRFDRMIGAGALDEVRRLLALGLPPTAPAMRALGVPALASHLKGLITLDAAVARGKAETRQYVKRQETWLKRNMSSWNIVDMI